MKIKAILSLLRHTQAQSFAKKDLLIKEGAKSKDVFFIRKGIVRSFYQNNEKPEETTFQLYTEYNVVLNLHAVLFNEPSQFTYQALEPTKVYRIDYPSLLDLTSNNTELLELNRTFLGRNALRKAFLRVESFVFMSPEERYLNYVKEYPKIVDRVPDKYIANVLGITPVSLSRIRMRIATKKK